MCAACDVCMCATCEDVSCVQRVMCVCNMCGCVMCAACDVCMCAA